MDRSEIDVLTAEYKDALQTEQEQIVGLVVAHRSVELIKIAVLSKAVIDGKNADTRKKQTAAALSDAPDYQRSLEILQQAETYKALASIAVRVADAHNGLIKAWLYSQSRVF